MCVFNKKRYKNKITFYEEEKKVGLTYRWLLQKVIRRFVESNPEKSFVTVNCKSDLLSFPFIKLILFFISSLLKTYILLPY